MKPFLGIDLTTDRNNTTANGDELLIAESLNALSQSLKYVQETKPRNSRTPFSRLRLFCGIAMIFLGYSIIAVPIKKHITFAQAYQASPVVHWVFICCTIIWVILKVSDLFKKKKTSGSRRVVENVEGSEANVEKVTEILIPTDAKEVDILSFYYKARGNKIKVYENGLNNAPYINVPFKAFTDFINLYIADSERKYSIPIYAIKSIRTVRQDIQIRGWNKAEPYNSSGYLQYNLRADSRGCIVCERYYIIDFYLNNQEWGIYIPSYELPVFEELTGLKATDK